MVLTLLPLLFYSPQCLLREKFNCILLHVKETQLWCSGRSGKLHIDMYLLC